MSPKVDRELFGIAEQSHQHFIDLLNQVRVMRAATLDEAFQKRLFLYHGILLNETIGELFLLCTHDALRRTQPALRSAWEYIVRATYYTQRSGLNNAHFAEIWPKLNRLYEQLQVLPEITEQIETAVTRFTEQHPDWHRPHEAGLKPILDEMYGQRRSDRLYARWYTYNSPMTHGTYDGIANVLGHDGQNTVVKPGPNIANCVLAEATRFTLQMAVIMKRRYGLTGQTLSIFRHFVERCRYLRVRVGTPPPFPRPTVRFLAKS